MGVMVRLCRRPRTPSVALHLFSALYPDLSEYLISGRYRPNGPRGPCRGIVAACAARRDLRTPEGSEDDLEIIQFRTHKMKKEAKRRRKARGRLGRQPADGLDDEFWNPPDSVDRLYPTVPAPPGRKPNHCPSTPANTELAIMNSDAETQPHSDPK